MAILPEHILRQRLLRLDSCVISDAADRLGISGVAQGIHRLSTQERLAGPVLTVRLEAAQGRLADRHLCTGAIESASPGDVIVVEHHSRADCAGWGGILSRAALIRGVSGAIVDGLCRDIDEGRDLNFPIFARGTFPATARGRVIETGFNSAVQIGGILVQPRDWVVADGSGVVFIPAPQIETILDEAEKLVAREQRLIADLENGTPASQVMSHTYEHMTRKEEEL